MSGSRVLITLVASIFLGVLLLAALVVGGILTLPFGLLLLALGAIIAALFAIAQIAYALYKITEQFLFAAPKSSKKGGDYTLEQSKGSK